MQSAFHRFWLPVTKSPIIYPRQSAAPRWVFRLWNLPTALASQSSNSGGSDWSLRSICSIDSCVLRGSRVRRRPVPFRSGPRLRRLFRRRGTPCPWRRSILKHSVDLCIACRPRNSSPQWDIRQQIGLDVSKSRVIPPKTHSLSRLWPYAPVTSRSAPSSEASPTS